MIKTLSDNVHRLIETRRFSVRHSAAADVFSFSSTSMMTLHVVFGRRRDRTAVIVRSPLSQLSMYNVKRCL